MTVTLETPAKHRRISFGLGRFSGLYLLALFILGFSLWEPDLFPTMGTVHSIASGNAVAGMLALAVLVPLVAGAYDLSVGAVANFAAILVVEFQNEAHWSVVAAILATVLITTLIGAFNGLLVVKFGVSSFIATLGMATIVTALQGIVSGEVQPSPPLSSAWNNLTSHTVFGFQIIFLYLIILAVVIWWALEHTPAGRYLHAVGGNSEAARLAGVRVDNWTWISLMASAALAGISGVLYSSLSGPSLTFGTDLLLPAFAAVFLGATQLRPGRFNVWGTMLAVFVLATGEVGLSLATGVQWLNDMFSGVALIVAVAFAVWRQRKA